MAPQITKFTKENLYALADDASLSQRKRVNRNFHKDSFDPINRLCISMIKGTYVRPHRHPDKWELMLTISGEIGVLIFNDAGEVIDTFKLFSKGMLIFEMEPGTWHTLYSISEHAAFFEVKPGPFLPTAQKDFATWAPEENSSEVSEFLNWASKANKGDKFNYKQ